MQLKYAEFSSSILHSWLEDIHSGSILVIELPNKIWQPEVSSTYKMPVYDDVDEGVFEFQSYGKCVSRPTNSWNSASHNNIVQFDNTEDIQEVEIYIHIGD